jgi:oxygen-independent coproporphyrinogen-3 oxidase
LIGETAELARLYPTPLFMSTNCTPTLDPRFSPPRSAYLHVPFCVHRCGYCNFTLVADRDDLIPQFLVAIERELSLLEVPRPVDTLFFGGGTPSHLTPDRLRQLITIARHWFDIGDDPEFTVEANPLDMTPDRIAVLRAGGVTRLSLGVQSFDNRTLRGLDRNHRGEDVERALALARGVFSSISMDLMFGAPGQSLHDWRDDLERAVQAQPQHVSVYGLTFERGTRFWSQLQRDELQRCPEELERNMYELAIDCLTAAGYEHYEVSNFAQPGFRCRHNEAYWAGCTYFAAGPGAARHIQGRREVNHRSTTTYLRRVLAGESPVAESEFLSPEDAARERFVIGMRRLAGVNAVEFAKESGKQVTDLFGEPLARFLAEGLMEQDGEWYRLTRAGLLISDALWPDIL